MSKYAKSFPQMAKLIYQIYYENAFFRFRSSWPGTAPGVKLAALGATRETLSVSGKSFFLKLL